MTLRHPYHYWLGMFFTLWLALCLYSFSQLDLNLTLYPYPWISKWIGWMQQLGYYARPGSTITFLGLSVGLLVSYRHLVQGLRSIHSVPKNALYGMLGFFCLTGIASYPLFSHDVFNYLFNAKMVLVYGVNPHLHTALEFVTDPWVRFMHNIHTPAPYAYGWTGISVAVLAGFISNFTLSFWAIKGWIALMWLGEGILIYKIANRLFPKEAFFRTGIFILNPLILMETLIVGHNDSAMMVLALLSAYLLIRSDQNLSSLYQVTAWISWALSVATKYATLTLLPFLALRKHMDVFTWGGIALLVVVLSRLDQVHSWYFHWGMSFLVLSNYRWALTVVWLLTIGGLLRYAPFVYFGHWDQPVVWLRWLILFVPISLIAFKSHRWL